MNNSINITCNKQTYTVWINNTIFLVQPIYYSNKIPGNITPQAYWYLHILHVLSQHGLLHGYKNVSNLYKGF